MPIKRLRKILRVSKKKQEMLVLKNTKYSADDMYKQLTEGLCVIIFTKKTTQAVRRMKCTLNSKLVPRIIAKTLKSSEYYDIIDRQYQLGLIIVWDIEKNDWRSFYINNVHDFKLEQENKR